MKSKKKEEIIGAILHDYIEDTLHICVYVSCVLAQRTLNAVCICVCMERVEHATVCM